MGIFWCISITYNVKSCKKINEKAQTAKFTVFAREISSAVLKTWKTGKTKTWNTQNFQILYHIQGTTIWELTSWSSSSQYQNSYLDLQSETIAATPCEWITWSLAQGSGLQKRFWVYHRQLAVSLFGNTQVGKMRNTYEHQRVIGLGEIYGRTVVISPL